jgi:arabinose-5-phosphate isomerase
MPWQTSLHSHIQNLSHMLENLDETQVEKALTRMRDCQGLIVFTGIGQNLIMASKVAATYNSLSLRAVSVDPVSSLHGSMSFVRPEDLLVPLSKSGETPELLRFLDGVSKLADCDVLSIHAARGCPLERRSAYSVYLPLLGEADHLNLAPTASSGCFLAFLQALAVQLASMRGLTRADFARTHPEGTLGRQAAMVLP